MPTLTNYGKQQPATRTPEEISAYHAQWLAGKQDMMDSLATILDRAIITDAKPGTREFYKAAQARRLYQIETAGTDRPAWWKLTTEERQSFIRQHRPPTVIDRCRSFFTRHRG